VDDLEREHVSDIDEDEDEDEAILFEMNEKSGRHAILDEHDGTVWFYLTEKDGMMPIADVWVRNSSRSQPTKSETSPPPAPPSVTLPGADKPVDYEQCQWKVRWNADGNAAALLMDGNTIAFLSATSKFGWNREITQDKGWGKPWSDVDFRELFAKK
jgi:hypothetical protein